MKAIVITLSILALSGCAAKLSFIDRTDGTAYSGTSGSTAGNSGKATATIAGANYSGTWVYSPSGGGYTLGTFNGTSTAADGTVHANFGSATAMTVSAQGNGLLTLRSDDGHYLRCVFTYNSMSATGLGECIRNDGRQFDLTVN